MGDIVKNVRVYDRAREVVAPSIYGCDRQWSFADLFTEKLLNVDLPERYREGFRDDPHRLKASVSTDGSTWIHVELNLNIAVVCSHFNPTPTHVKYNLDCIEEPVKRKVVPAFEIMNRVRLPARRNVVNNKDQLYNDFVDLLSKHNAGWHPSSLHIGKELVTVLTDVWWYFQGQHEKIQKYNAPIASTFNLPNEPYLDYKSRQRGVPPLREERLVEMVTQLLKFEESNWMRSAKWSWMLAKVNTLRSAIAKVASKLKKKSADECARKASQSVPRDKEIFSFLTTIDFCDEKEFKPNRVLSEVVSKLRQCEDYEPVFLNEITTEMNSTRWEKCRSFKSLKVQGLPIENVRIFEHDHSGRIGSLVWAFKYVDDTVPNMTRQNKLKQLLQKQIPQCHTRAMIKTFIDRYDALDATPAHPLLVDMYQFLTDTEMGDFANVRKEVFESLQELLDSEDKAVLTDFRSANGREQGKFDYFFNEFGRFLEAERVVQDNRSSELGYMPAMTSLANGHAKVVKRLIDKGCKVGGSGALCALELLKLNPDTYYSDAPYSKYRFTASSSKGDSQSHRVAKKRSKSTADNLLRSLQRPAKRHSGPRVASGGLVSSSSSSTGPSSSTSISSSSSSSTSETPMSIDSGAPDCQASKLEAPQEAKQEPIVLVGDATPAVVYVPSLEYLRLQFWPSNTTSLIAHRHTGRFDVKMKVQSRSLRKRTVDSKYCSKLLKNMKCFLVEWRKRLQMVGDLEHKIVDLFTDDKSKISLGELGLPVAPGARSSKKIHVYKDGVMLAGDHDHKIKQHAIVSSGFIGDIPESIDGPWFRGRPFFTIKNDVFEQSTCHRTLIETYYALKKARADRAWIVCLVTDGGPEHNLTYSSVQLACMALFLHFPEIVQFMAIRTPPGESWRNLAERVNCRLNAGLQGVSFMRQKMSQHAERLMKSKDTIKEIRELATYYDFIEGEVLKSVEPAHSALAKLFCQLMLHDQHFMEVPKATKDDITEWSEIIHKIDGSIDLEKVVKAALQDKQKLQAFVEKHFVCTPYYLRGRNCNDASCEFCPSMKMPRELYDQLHDIPLPVLKKGQTEEYKTYEETKRQCPPDVSFQPSLKRAGNLTAGGSMVTWSLIADKVRDYITCVNCNLPRCLFAKKALSKVEQKLLTMHKEQIHYTCGDALFSIPDESKYYPISDLVDVVVTKGKLQCGTQVNSQYYSACVKGVRFQRVCCFCGESLDQRAHLLRQEQLKVYKTVYPRCTAEQCVAKGWLTRSKINKGAAKPPQKRKLVGRNKREKAKKARKSGGDA